MPLSYDAIMAEICFHEGRVYSRMWRRPHAEIDAGDARKVWDATRLFSGIRDPEEPVDRLMNDAEREGPPARDGVSPILQRFGEKLFFRGLGGLGARAHAGMGFSRTRGELIGAIQQG
jgi:hypothetical protein